MTPFIIHAGTHKTATSYIQSRLRANRERLLSLGLRTGYPGPEANKHKPLAAAVRRGDWRCWQRYLDGLGRGADPVLVSAEQFTQPLSRIDRFEPLARLLADRGYRLKVVVFVRDQPDYMNARYVHSTRRLYHCLPFNTYVHQQLRRRAHIFDYELLFGGLLGCSLLDLDVLPYRVGLGDPFERLMRHLGWNHGDGWLPADRSRGNIQPGRRGVWLAQQISERLRQQGINPRRLKNTGSVVRCIAQREGWSSDRYFGFSGPLGQRVADHYAAANGRLAQRIWGQPWEACFPEPLPEQRVYCLPDAGPDQQAMLARVEEAMASLTPAGSHP